MPMGEHNPNLDVDNLHLTAEEVAARDAAKDINVDTDVVESGVALKSAAKAFGAQLRSTVAVANAFITKSVKESPALTLGGAAGAGFVVGGGLSAPLTRSLMRVGLKAGSAFFLDAAMKTLGAIATQATTSPDSDSTRDSRRATSSADALSSDTSNFNGETP